MLRTLVRKRLAEFKINYDSHIFASVTDGASVMVKFARISSHEGQLCQAHGIHLAVCDVMYVKKEEEGYR